MKIFSRKAWIIKYYWDQLKSKFVVKSSPVVFLNNNFLVRKFLFDNTFNDLVIRSTKCIWHASDVDRVRSVHYNTASHDFKFVLVNWWNLKVSEIFPNVFMEVVLSVASDEKLFVSKICMLYQNILSIFTTVNFALGKSAKINWQMSSCRPVQARRTQNLPSERKNFVSFVDSSQPRVHWILRSFYYNFDINISCFLYCGLFFI